MLCVQKNSGWSRLITGACILLLFLDIVINMFLHNVLNRGSILLLHVCLIFSVYAFLLSCNIKQDWRDYHIGVIVQFFTASEWETM